MRERLRTHGLRREQLQSKHCEKLSHREEADQAQTLEKKKWYTCGLLGKNSLKEGAMWHRDLLLGKDLETMKTCLYNNKVTVEIVFSTQSVQRSYLEENWRNPVSC
jgi:hypothetical protein